MQPIENIKSISLREEVCELIKLLMYEHFLLYGQVVENLVTKEFCVRRPDLAEKIHKEMLNAELGALAKKLMSRHPPRADESPSKYQDLIVALAVRALRA